MKKHNLFKISLSAAVLATAILFTGCPGEAEKTVDNTPVENPENKDSKDSTSQDNPDPENKTDKPSPADSPVDNPVEENPIDNPTEEAPIEQEPVPQITFVPVPTLSFNTTNAEALASVIPSSQNRSARTARSSRAAEAEELEESGDSEALLQKILDDGSVEDAMKIEGGESDTDWNNIDYIILPPENVNSSDIYLLMKDYTTTRVTIINETIEEEPEVDTTINDDSTDNDVVEGKPKIDESAGDENINDEPESDEVTDNETTQDETLVNENEQLEEESEKEESTVTTIAEDKVTIKEWTLSSLICVHADNTYDDVILESPYDVQSFGRIDSKENIQFLKDGSVVYLYRGEGYDHFLYKWDPVTKKRTLLCKMELPATEGSLFVRKFSISNDEDYIYLYIDRVDANYQGFYYLKIIKLSDPTFDKEIGNEFPGVKGWCYSPYDDSLYYAYISYTESKQGLFKADKKGDNPEFLGYDTYSYLIPQSTQKVWGQAGYDDNIYKLRNILSEKTEEGLLTEEISYTAPEHYYFWGDYIFANDTLYLWHRFGCDSTNGHKDAIIAVPLNDPNSEPKNLLDFNKDLQLHSWDVNENSLFISGFNYETKEPVNSKIDLKSDKQTTIQSDSAFGAIAAL